MSDPSIGQRILLKSVSSHCPWNLIMVSFEARDVFVKVNVGGIPQPLAILPRSQTDLFLRESSKEPLTGPSKTDHLLCQL
jgi:hypothetical protein